MTENDAAIEEPAVDISGNPQREFRLLALAAVGCSVALGAWLFLCPLDAAITSTGQVVVLNDHRTVQAAQSGLVSALYVREGDHVTAGQLLASLRPTDTAATANNASTEVIYNLIEAGRLQAELAGQTDFAKPENLNPVDAVDVAQADGFYRSAQAALRANRSSDAAQVHVIERRISELDRQISGFQDQIQAIDEQARLIEEELVGIRKLAERGFTPLSQVRSLERSAASLRGTRAGLSASIAQAREQQGEFSSEILAQRDLRRATASEQFRQVMQKVRMSEPQLKAAREHLSDLELRAPVAGRVVGLTVSSSGISLDKGKALLDIVPDRSPTVIQAKISPVQSAELRVGQIARLRLLGGSFRQAPVLEGKVARISADSMRDVDGKTEYFSVEINLLRGEESKISHQFMGVSTLKPGLLADVMIPLKSRTAYEYIVEPFRGAFWSSFRER